MFINSLMTDNDTIVDKGLMFYLDEDIIKLDKAFLTLENINEMLNETIDHENLDSLITSQENVMTDIKKKMNTSFAKLSKIFDHLKDFYRNNLESLSFKKKTFYKNIESNILNNLNEIDNQDFFRMNVKNCLTKEHLTKAIVIVENSLNIVEHFESIINESWREGTDILPPKLRSLITSFKDIGIIIPDANRVDNSSYKKEIQIGPIGELGYNLNQINNIKDLIKNHIPKSDKLQKIESYVNSWSKYITKLNQNKDNEVNQFQRVRQNRTHVFLKLIEQIFIIEKDILNTGNNLLEAIKKLKNDITNEAFAIKEKVKSDNQNFILAFKNFINTNLDDNQSINNCLTDINRSLLKLENISTTPKIEFNFKNIEVSDIEKFNSLSLYPKNLQNIFLDIFNSINDSNDYVSLNSELDVSFNNLGIDFKGEKTLNNTSGNLSTDMLLNNSTEIIKDITLSIVDNIKFEKSTLRDLGYSLSNLKELMTNTKNMMYVINTDKLDNLTNNIKTNIETLDSSTDFTFLSKLAKKHIDSLVALSLFKTCLLRYRDQLCKLISIYEYQTLL